MTMAWEKRGQHLYYYRVHRRNGRVVKEYLGRGPAAVAAAQQDAARQAERAARQLDLAVTEQIMAAGKEADALVDAALLAAGYHRPQRKAWRKRKSRRT